MLDGRTIISLLCATWLAAGCSISYRNDGRTGQRAPEIIHHPLPDNSTFPIARAVEVISDVRTLYHSGLTPRPADDSAERGTRAYWGDTEAQARSVLGRISESLDGFGYSLGDVTKMTVFLVGDPELGGRMDFDGFMRAYTELYGATAERSLPARSAVQVAGLVAPGMWVEIEVIAVRAR